MSTYVALVNYTERGIQHIGTRPSASTRCGGSSRRWAAR